MGSLGNATAPDEHGRPIVASWPLHERVHLPDPTVAEQFKAAGYETALIGKWHIHTAPELVGFDYTLHPRVNHRHTGQDFVENGGPPQLVDGFSVDYENEKVLSYLAADRDNPFFLYYSISPPHMPLADAPSEYLTMYDPEEVPLRPNVFLDGQMAYDENWFNVYLWDFLYYSLKLPHTLDLPQGFRPANTDSALLRVDDLGRRHGRDGMMAGLRANGLLDNTIVVFTSDHGDNLGSHHRFNKGLLIEESIRIPMIFHAPWLWEARCQQFTSRADCRCHADGAGSQWMRGTRARAGTQSDTDSDRGTTTAGGELGLHRDQRRRDRGQDAHPPAGTASSGPGGRSRGKS